MSGYDALRKVAPKNLSGDDTTTRLSELITESLAYLSQSDTVPLRSLVLGKQYFSFRRDKKLSRPVRTDLFDFKIAKTYMPTYREGKFRQIVPTDLDKLLYTCGISYCCVADIKGNGDKKTPGTFFEYFIGNIFARELGVTPRNRVEVLNLDMKASLPTDFIFDLGKESRRIHLPVKLSTRERVVQVWAHQRVLDGVYGVGRFRGVATILTETKLDARKLEVVEICLPDQWNVYQMFIAQMYRMYYLDVPHRYAQLDLAYPNIQVRPLSDFFKEKKMILGGVAD